MIYLWMFLALCIVCVSGYIGQVLNIASAVSSFFGMVILAALIYYFTMWLTGGNELATGIFMFLAPACGLMIRFGGVWKAVMRGRYGVPCRHLLEAAGD
ncbi:DUF2545 domain-containing protein [Escherichia marmotae]|nr:DUF2545 domain-containing protein [Escherichia marmotae]